MPKTVVFTPGNEPDSDWPPIFYAMALNGKRIIANNDDESEDIMNPAQLKISLDFEKKDKPHIEAINELLDGKIDFEYKK